MFLRCSFAVTLSVFWLSMKIVGHTDYQTTANIYTHIKEEMLKKATVDLEGVFKKRAGKERDWTMKQPRKNGSRGCCSLFILCFYLR